MGRMSRSALLGVAVAVLAFQAPSTATAGDGVSCHGKSPLRKLCGGGGPAAGTESGGDEPDSRSGDEVYDSSSTTAGPKGASN
ncbi:hypothetical protein PS9374_06720 [Planomonospora sphaerica]|uniref:Uncharacterized protein n=1 Tax=Planomonospora sphaerica TaxID=161355 RepID=A0A161LYR5_9ACTN|nr:hypothetical protein PS9374_06720 [Planomonospora sphaerica]